MGRTFLGGCCERAETDHPHARGENRKYDRRFYMIAGPSPRAWGERSPPPPPWSGIRTIPTRVGRTTPPSETPEKSTDHPHARGENLLRILFFGPRCGPSPRAWGEPRAPSISLRYLRTIPTRVGRTRRTTSSAARPADHPHARGENPHARGENPGLPAVYGDRIIKERVFSLWPETPVFWSGARR